MSPDPAGPAARPPRAADDPAAAGAPKPPRRPLEVRRLGVIEYAAGLRLQEELVERRRRDEIPDQLLLLEHPHVITLGTSAHRENVLLDERERRLLGIQLFETGRGGDVTYHGPGQLVGYPILDLKPDRQDLHRYVHDIEEALIRAIARFGLTGTRKSGLTGVWVGEDKIAAIGVRVSSGWITSHGFALNVTTDLQFFDSIIPCGIRDHGVTSLARTAAAPPTLAEVMDAVEAAFRDVFEHA